MRTCEVCGSAASVCVVDRRETAPVSDDSGQHWQTFAATGTHWFCQAHRREGRVESLTDEERCAAMMAHD